jgi:hypothetical protein
MLLVDSLHGSVATTLSGSIFGTIALLTAIHAVAKGSFNELLQQNPKMP